MLVEAIIESVNFFHFYHSRTLKRSYNRLFPNGFIFQSYLS